MTATSLHQRAPAQTRPAPARLSVALDAGQAAVLYDADCSLCRAVTGALVAWDRGGRLVPVAIQDALGETLLPELEPDERLASFHVITAEGDRYSGGPALEPVFDRLRGGRPLAALVRRFERPTAAAYEFVAANRGTLVKLIPAPARRSAERRLAQRLDR